MRTGILSTSLRTAVLAAIIAIAGAFAGVQEATAQVCCPWYTAVARNTVPAACFPVTITTAWSNGITGTSVHPAPGAQIVNAPAPPGCWNPPIVGIIVNGTPVPVPPPGACVAVALPCGAVQVCIQIDAAGCVRVIVQ